MGPLILDEGMSLQLSRPLTVWMPKRAVSTDIAARGLQTLVAGPLVGRRRPLLRKAQQGCTEQGGGERSNENTHLHLIL